MLKLEYKDYTLDFKFEAGTSRGILTEHPVIFIKVYSSGEPDTFGLGEAAPLYNLSPETLDDVREYLPDLIADLKKVGLPQTKESVFSLAKRFVPAELPSLKMALETALLDLIGGGSRMIFNNKFSQGKQPIPINGLIWMGDSAMMQEQISVKLTQGYKCVKMKIGAIDFDQELSLIEQLREHSDRLIIRVDANGAFPTNEAFAKISKLEPFGIHSIEQPIMAGQLEAMQLLCKRTKVPIALDEELIGIYEVSQKQELLRMIRPQFIILKPTLLGGFASTLEWIRIAEQMGIGWWLTSALESNISLNAIAQFAGDFEDLSYQGLGTGQLYHNNINSPLQIDGSYLSYNTEKSWDQVF